MSSSKIASYDAQRRFFSTGSTKDVGYRIKALKRLKRNLIEQEDAICEALYADFKKPKFESLVTETQFVLAELEHIIKNLGFWVRPKRVGGSLSSFPSRDWIQYEPFGQVLVISPWNYPFMLALSPVIGAIAAGNTVVLKPSELSPATSKVLAKLIAESFAPEHVKVVEGGVAVSQELLSLRWNYIFFTGSTQVGKIVYKCAAEHLTPVTLELGGKNPCIVDQSASIKIAAKRIGWGKFLNAGQTCLAPDYLLVHQSKKEELVRELIKNITKSYGSEVENSKDFARIATPKQYKRLKAMLAEGSVLYGGTHNDAERYISPTLIENPSMDSLTMQDEIFGPILPIFTYENEDEIDAFVSRYDKPLGFYIFSNRKRFQKKLVARYGFGGGVINDTVLQIVNKNLPFGGVGNSGFGGYHAKHSFELFSHKKAMVKKPLWFELPVRYAPYRFPERLTKLIRKVI
ncbi:MAG: aldehyde dehydrogenase [Flavobacteriaceae bacterium]|nr:aldehyde dehydrogenase [Flavobacteriaceae bacterium]